MYNSHVAEFKYVVLIPSQGDSACSSYASAERRSQLRNRRDTALLPRWLPETRLKAGDHTRYLGSGLGVCSERGIVGFRHGPTSAYHLRPRGLGFLRRVMALRI